MSYATKRGPCGGRSATAQPPGAQLRALAPVKVQPAATQERARRTSFTDGIAGRAAAASVATSAAVQMAERRGIIQYRFVCLLLLLCARELSRKMHT